MSPVSSCGIQAFPSYMEITHTTQVLKFGDDAPYCVQATLEWGSMSDFQKATQDKAAMDAIMGDVSNFSNTTPKLMTGEVVGSK